MQYQLEKWADLVRDGSYIFPIHYEELSLHKDQVPMGCDFDLYQQIEDLGRLHVLTAREDGKIVGYFTAICIKNHPHNKDAGPVSTTDMFYILPDYRRGGAGAKLLIKAAETLKERGIKKASISVKLHQNHRALLEALGWEATDLVLQKLL